jgi:hypothetical protein
LLGLHPSRVASWGTNVSVVVVVGAKITFTNRFADTDTVIMNHIILVPAPSTTVLKCMLTASHDGSWKDESEGKKKTRIAKHHHVVVFEVGDGIRRSNNVRKATKI